MREFFKPLRRKIGVITLIVACLFAGLWVRSLRVGERMRLRVDQKFATELFSCTGDLIWEGYWFADPKNKLMTVEWLTYDHNLDPATYSNPRPGLVPFCGFAHGYSEFTRDGYQLMVVKVRYWLIVTPLTLISA